MNNNIFLFFQKKKKKKSELQCRDARDAWIELHLYSSVILSIQKHYKSYENEAYFPRFCFWNCYKIDSSSLETTKNMTKNNTKRE